MYGMFWDWRQDARIAEVAAKASVAQDKAVVLEADVLYLKKKLEHVSLACQAMWELLRDHCSLSEEQLRTRIEQVDLRDGMVDGRIHHQPVTCPSCGRAGSSRRRQCLYCGENLTSDHAFE